MDKHPDIAYNKSDEIRLRMRRRSASHAERNGITWKNCWMPCSENASPTQLMEKSPPTSRSWPRATPATLGIYVLRSDGRHYQAGSYRKHFTIQSVVKPILLLLALLDNGEEVVRAKVGVEATGKPFDAHQCDRLSPAQRPSEPDGQYGRHRHLHPDPRLQL